MDDLDEEMEQELHEMSQEIGEKVKEFTERVHPLRIALAGVIFIMLLGALASTWYWVIPRDDVEIEVVYLQRNGHIVLTELFNDGSRDITDVSLNVNFRDMDGNVLGKIDVKFDSIPSHTSISGDKMEIDVRGYTVWDDYTIQIDIEWTDFNGIKNQESERYSVSESQTAIFLYECEEVTWFL